MMARGEKVSANTPWTDDELRQSVGVYVLLLRLQLRGSEERSEPVAQALLLDPLALRNDAAIRYRMRNISAVVKDLGGPVLTDFSPAESVGKLIRPRIRAMLLADPDFSRLLGPTPGVGGDDLGNAKKALSIIRRQIEDLEAELAWHGHNGPPRNRRSQDFQGHPSRSSRRHKAGRGRARKNSARQAHCRGRFIASPRLRAETDEVDRRSRYQVH